MSTSNGHRPTTLTEAQKVIDQLESEKADAKIEWPDTVQDVNIPLSAMLHDLNLLEKGDGSRKTWLGTPFDMQAITAGATAATKITVPSVGVAGLLGSIAAYLKGFSASGPADWVLLGCGTVLLAVTIIAVASLIKADLKARATASAAQYRARAYAADAYLRTVQPMAHKTSAPVG